MPEYLLKIYQQQWFREIYCWSARMLRKLQERLLPEDRGTWNNGGLLYPFMLNTLVWANYSTLGKSWLLNNELRSNGLWFYFENFLKWMLFILWNNEFPKAICKTSDFILSWLFNYGMKEEVHIQKSLLLHYVVWLMPNWKALKSSIPVKNQILQEEIKGIDRGKNWRNSVVYIIDQKPFGVLETGFHQSLALRCYL